MLRRGHAPWPAWLCVGLLAMILHLPSALAQPLSGPEPTEHGSAPAAADAARPWAKGVAAAEQARALELYMLGNGEFAESRFAQALAKYRAAIAHWDHPAIHFNMAVCLINLGQPTDARQHLEKSLAYGPPALGAEAHAQAITYRKLLDAQLTHLTVRCAEPDALVTLDGKLLFAGPGTATRYLLPGEHQVVAAKPGLQADLQTLTLSAGVPAAIELRPQIARSASPQMVRRWPTWQPWSVLGGGGAIIGIGAIAYFVAKNDFAAYDRGVEQHCPSGCSAAMLAMRPALARTKDRAELEQVAAFSLFSAGGTAVLAGVIGLFLNQPRVRPTKPSRVAITPVLSGATISMSWGF